jgi:hypothetical protein
LRLIAQNQLGFYTTELATLQVELGKRNFAVAEEGRMVA